MIKFTNKAFTLIEVLIAIVILVLIIGSTIVIFQSASKTWLKGEERAQRYQNARVILERIARELSSGFKGSMDEVYFVGIDRDSDKIKSNSGADEIFFVSSLSESGRSDVTEIGYWLRKDDNTLIRHFDTDIDYDFTTCESDDELGDNILDLDFQYYNKETEQWQDSWDSTKSGNEAGFMPEAVKISIEVEDVQHRKSEVFSTIVYIPIGGVE